MKGLLLFILIVLGISGLSVVLAKMNGEDWDENL